MIELFILYRCEVIWASAAGIFPASCSVCSQNIHMYLLWPQTYTFLPQHCFPCTFWRCEQRSQRAKAELLFMGRLSKDLTGFFYSCLPPLFLRASHRSKAHILLSFSTSPDWLSLLIKWLLPISRHQTRRIQPKAKFWRNLARQGCPQTTAGKRCQVHPCPIDLQA